MKTKYTKELLEPITKNCTSIGQVLDQLNLKRTGGNYQHINGVIVVLKIDISHFKGYSWNKGMKTGPCIKKRTPLKNILKNGVHFNCAHLRDRLISEGIFKEECIICGQGPTWNNIFLRLQLDHINGNRTDNRLENLRILCPNCHTQTPTHSGKNKKH